MSGDEAAFTGIKKLFVPVFTSTLIIVGAFSPLLNIPDEVGKFLRTLPQVVMICNYLLIYICTVYNPCYVINIF